MACVTMATVAETVLVPSAVEVPTIVTVLPVGMAAGAVNTVVPPLAVCAGRMVPHGAPPQLSVQSTPLLPESLVTVAIILAVRDTTIDCGGGWENATETPVPPEVIVIVAVAVLV